MTDLGPWEPLSLAAVAELFRGYEHPWWIAGGWAIELFAGRPVRPHADVDVLVLREHQHLWHDLLPGWDVQAADPPGQLRPWLAGETLPAYVHDIWCRERPDGPWRFQFMVDDTVDGQWRSRRDPALTRPVADLTRRSVQGWPYLAPEVQLHHKAKSRRPKDQVDFDAAAPLLDAAARAWLVGSLRRTSPGHPWIVALSG